MNYADKLSNVTVLGAAGKMGSGILLLTALELTRLKLLPENKGKSFVVNAMDLSEEGLQGLVAYLKKQASKSAQKKPEKIAALYAEEIPAEELEARYVEDVMSVVNTTTTLKPAYNSEIIFEAVSENPDLKVKIFSEINENSTTEPWFFTNTSSIPIQLIDDRTSLDGRTLGFHFYNPPAIQKLAEIIRGEKTKDELFDFALELAKNLKKVVVNSNDFAGFIGNGHFMRDALYGIQRVEDLMKDMGFAQAIQVVNTVTQRYLVRPMGIFQLVDYVGIDVVQYIMNVMNPYLENEDLHSDLLDKFIEKGVKGGQNSDGSQKDGILKYEGPKIVGIYDLEKEAYVPVSDVKDAAKEYIGAGPESMISWKDAMKAENRDEVLAKMFGELKTMDASGAKLAVAYGQNSKKIGELLINMNVAANSKDVNTVLMTGFFHSYGPVNEYFD
jgi:3-hydroxyacyl-CoA dehydrogenase